MDTKGILVSLRQERDRIDKVIDALEALDITGSRTTIPGKRVAAKSTATPGRRARRKPLTAAAKKHLSDMMKKRWAERKKKQKKG